MITRQFISYPKSGRTWIRYVLHALGKGELVEFHHDGFEFNDGSLPVHDFDIERRRRVYRRVEHIVYLRRDPRDIIVSLYHQVTERFADYFDYRGALSEFIRDDYFGAQVLARFRSVWDELAHSPSVLVVDYEDCHRDLIGVMQRILDHYGFQVNPERLREVCDSSSLSRMREIELSGAFPHPWLKLRNGAPKVRRGQVGNYADELDEADIRYLDQIFGTEPRVPPRKK